MAFINWEREKRGDRRIKHFLLAAGLFSLTIIYINYLGTVKATPLIRPLNRFPETIGNFKLKRESSFDEAVINKLGVDDYIMWSYQDDAGYEVGLYVGFYEWQSEGNIIHSPRHCMPGSGWRTIRPIGKVSIITGNNNEGINQMYLRKGEEKMLVHYWYQSRGRVIANEYLDRMYMIIDSLLKRRSDGAFIRITGPVENFKEAEEKQLSFAGQVLPRLKSFLPR